MLLPGVEPRPSIPKPVAEPTRFFRMSYRLWWCWCRWWELIIIIRRRRAAANVNILHQKFTSKSAGNWLITFSLSFQTAHLCWEFFLVYHWSALRTDYMDNCPSLPIQFFPAGQDISRLLWNRNMLPESVVHDTSLDLINFFLSLRYLPWRKENFKWVQEWSVNRNWQM